MACMTSLGIKDGVAYFVDLNPRRQGKFIPAVEKEIMSPDHARENRPDVVIAMNAIYRVEIRRAFESEWDEFIE